MKALPLSLFILVGCSDLSAQDSTLVTIKAGNRVNDVLPPTEIFYYLQFTNGNVILRDGTKIEATMNYNRLFDQMLFIGPKSDTLALSDEKNIKFITIDKDTFYYDHGYIRIIADNVFVKLAGKQIRVVADIRKIGTHNKPTSTVAVTAVSSYADGTAQGKKLRFPDKRGFGDKKRNTVLLWR